MWIFTDTGFVSAVADSANEEQLVVRARDRASLEPLAAIDGDQILVGVGTDYRYRVLCSRETFTYWVAEQATTIDYPNFKSRVTKTRGHRFADALMKVWTAMLAVDDTGESGLA